MKAEVRLDLLATPYTTHLLFCRPGHEKDIDNVQDCYGVNHKQNDKPPLVLQLRRAP